MADDGLTWDTDLVEASESAKLIRQREAREARKRQKRAEAPRRVAACPPSCSNAG